MNDLHPFGWYAARIKPLMPKKAFQAVPSRLLGGLLHILVVTACMVVIVVQNPPLYITCFLSIVIGVSFSGIGFLGHEIMHGTVVRHRRLQSLLGGIALFPLCTGPELWRKWHNLTHHLHTQDEEKDPDAWSTLEHLMTRPIFSKMYRLPFSIRKCFYFIFLWFNFTFVSLLRIIPYMKGEVTAKRGLVLLQFMLPWSFWFGLIFIGWEHWLFAFVIPHLIANFIVSSYIATNHNLNPMGDVNDPLANSLTVTVPKWVDLIHFNFSYHVEHHIFPGMNPKYYPLVKQHILTMWPDRYHEMPLWKAMFLLFKTPRVYYQKDHLIDPADHRLYPTLKPDSRQGCSCDKSGLQSSYEQ